MIGARSNAIHRQKQYDKPTHSIPLQLHPPQIGIIQISSIHHTQIKLSPSLHLHPSPVSNSVSGSVLRRDVSDAAGENADVAALIDIEVVLAREGEDEDEDDDVDVDVENEVAGERVDAEEAMVGEGVSAAPGFPKKRASWISVESSSPGMISGLAGLTFWTSLRTAVRSFGGVEGVEEEEGIVGE